MIALEKINEYRNFLLNEYRPFAWIEKNYIYGNMAYSKLVDFIGEHKASRIERYKSALMHYLTKPNINFIIHTNQGLEYIGSCDRVSATDIYIDEIRSFGDIVVVPKTDIQHILILEQ